MRQMHKAAVVK